MLEFVFIVRAEKRHFIFVLDAQGAQALHIFDAGIVIDSHQALENF